MILTENRVVKEKKKLKTLHSESLASLDFRRSAFNQAHFLRDPEPDQKLQDLVNKTMWKKCCFSGDGEYVCAGSARQHALYIWERSMGNLVKINNMQAKYKKSHQSKVLNYLQKIDDLDLNYLKLIDFYLLINLSKKL